MRHDDVDFPGDELSSQRRQTLELPLGPPIFDDEIPAFVVTQIAQALSSCARLPVEIPGRGLAEKTDAIESIESSTAGVASSDVGLEDDQSDPDEECRRSPSQHAVSDARRVLRPAVQTARASVGPRRVIPGTGSSAPAPRAPAHRRDSRASRGSRSGCSLRRRAAAPVCRLP